MKIKMLIPVALVLCLAFSLCACATNSNTNETTTAPATTVATEAKTEATTTEAATKATTAAATEAETEAVNNEFTEDDAIEMVSDNYSFGEDYYLMVRGTEEIDGESYYAVDLRIRHEVTTSYITSYFVKTDGSEIVEGYYNDDTPVISTGNATLTITEDNAVKAVEAAYDFEEGCHLNLRGTEEINGTTYYAVDLRKSLEVTSTYLGTYFVSPDGEIVLGYYEGDVAYLAE